MTPQTNAGKALLRYVKRLQEKANDQASSVELRIVDRLPKSIVAIEREAVERDQQLTENGG